MIKYALLTMVLTVSVAAIAVIDFRRPRYTPLPAESVEVLEIHATGIVEGASREVELRSEVVGRVVEVLVKPGQQVRSGEALVRLDDRHQTQLVEVSRARLDLAQAQLERLINGARDAERREAKALLEAAEAQLQQATRTWDRVRTLSKQAAVSQQQADEEESTVLQLTAEAQAARARYELVDSPARPDEVREAQARVAAAEAELKLAEVALEKCELQVPHDGCVLDVDVEPGDLLSPDAAVPAVILADVSALRVRAFVEEIDAPRVQLGFGARVRVDGLPGQEFKGVVAEISPRMSAKQHFDGSPEELYDTKVREVLVNLTNASGLMVGLRVDLSLTAPPGTDALQNAGVALSESLDGALP